MNVTIVAGGTRGDVDPYTGVAARLCEADHDVTMATHARFAELVRACGATYEPIPGDLHTVLASAAFQRWQQASLTGARLVRIIQQVREVMREIGDGVTAAILRRPDVLLLGNTIAPLGYHLADELGIPSLGLYWGPLDPTGDFPPIMAQYPSLGRWGNRTAAGFAQAMADAVYSPAVRRQRAALGLRPISLRRVRRRQRAQRWPILHGFSPAVVPRPSDWRPGLDIVGYWWPHRPAIWQPPPLLVDFLDAGPPPVFVGFGSMTPDDGERLSELAVTALRRAGVRGVVQAGWAGLTVSTDDIIGVGEVPHEWLLPRTAAVVHHAGAGTTGAALRAGVPAVPVPVMIDQFFWADRLARLGVASKPIPFPGLSADRLARGIRLAVDDGSHRRRAQALARTIDAEDGAGRVVEAVEHVASRAGRRS